MRRPELSDEAKSLVKAAGGMEVMLTSPTWKAYENILQTQIDSWGTKAVTPLADINGVLPAEFAKGAMFGLQLALATPATMVEQRKELLAKVSGSSGPQTEEDNE